METILAPWLGSYLSRYIRNFNPEDLTFSVWGGDVTLKVQLPRDPRFFYTN